jgi:protein O-mannosyl-transferase
MRHVPPDGRTTPVPWWPGVLVAAVTLLTFLPALRNDFVNWDDVENFLNNPHYRGLGWTNIRWMLTTAHLGHYIPVTWLTLGFDYVLWGMDPRGYHFTALVLHAVNALIFYILAYRLLELGFAARSKDPAEEEQRDTGSGGTRRGLALGAAIAALFFSVHPLRVESVVWITERRDLLAGLFSMLAVLAYLRSWTQGTVNGLRAAWYWASVGFFALALLSKSIAVGVPVVLLALDIYPLRRPRVTRILLEKAPFLLVSLMVSAIMLVIGVRSDLLFDLRTLGIFDRVAIFGRNLLFYLQKTIVPSSLSPLYEIHIPIHPFTARYLLPLTAAVAISVLMISLRRRWPTGLAVWTAYVVLLVPVSGLLQNGHQIAADRYTYLSCLGWALVAGAGVAWCWRARCRGTLGHPVAWIVIVVSATTIVMLAMLSALQIRVWHDGETLWRHAVAVEPDSAFAHYHLAGALSLIGKSEQARAEYARAVALAPATLDAKGRFLAALGRELHLAGHLEGAERSYAEALDYSGNDETALNNLGVIYALRGNNKGALDLFRRVLRVAPRDAAACHNLSVLSQRIGIRPRELDACPGPAS